jgi:hypothetical protein
MLKMRPTGKNYTPTVSLMTEKSILNLTVLLTLFSATFLHTVLMNVKLALPLVKMKTACKKLSVTETRTVSMNSTQPLPNGKPLTAGMTLSQLKRERENLELQRLLMNTP